MLVLHYFLLFRVSFAVNRTRWMIGFRLPVWRPNTRQTWCTYQSHYYGQAVTNSMKWGSKRCAEFKRENGKVHTTSIYLRVEHVCFDTFLSNVFLRLKTTSTSTTTTKRTKTTKTIMITTMNSVQICLERYRFLYKIVCVWSAINYLNGLNKISCQRFKSRKKKSFFHFKRVSSTCRKQNIPVDQSILYKRKGSVYSVWNIFIMLKSDFQNYSLILIR